MRDDPRVGRFSNMSDQEVVSHVAEYEGNQSLSRAGLAEMSRRLAVVTIELVEETRETGRKLVRLTWALVGLTILLVILTVVLLVKA